MPPAKRWGGHPEIQLTTKAFISSLTHLSSQGQAEVMDIHHLQRCEKMHPLPSAAQNSSMVKPSVSTGPAIKASSAWHAPCYNQTVEPFLVPDS
jgi:hypothetical protein